MVIRDEKYLGNGDLEKLNEEEENEYNTLPNKPSVREINLLKLNQSITNNKKLRP
jgi:hypothetical protein